MSEREELSKQIKETGEVFQKGLSDIRGELDTLREGNEKLSTDQQEKLDKMQEEFAKSAADLSKLNEQHEAFEKRMTDHDVEMARLEREGVTVPGGLTTDERMAAVHVMNMRNEVLGENKRVYGDTPETDLPTQAEVLAHDFAFDRYACEMQPDFNRLTNVPEETFAVGSSLFTPAYGIAVPAAMTGRMIGELHESGSMRGLALGRTVNSDAVNLMRFTGKTTITVGEEVTDWSAGDLPKFYDINYPIVDWVTTVSLHRNNVEDSAFDVVGFLTEEGRKTYAEKEAEYHISGDGNKKPTGILTLDKTTVAINELTKAEEEVGTVKVIKTGNAAGLGHATPANAAFAFNPLIAAINNLHSKYRANATIVLNRMSFANYAMMRNADGDYFMPMDQRVATDGSMRMMGTPVRINDHMPDPAANMYPVAVGDWSQAYEIADRRGLFMLVDPYTKKPNIEYSFMWRTGGRPADTRAYRLLQSAA